MHIAKGSPLRLNFLRNKIAEANVIWQNTFLSGIFHCECLGIYIQFALINKLICSNKINGFIYIYVYYYYYDIMALFEFYQNNFKN